jgi:hypothetical protein
LSTINNKLDTYTHDANTLLLLWLKKHEEEKLYFPKNFAVEFSNHSEILFFLFKIFHVHLLPNCDKNIFSGLLDSAQVNADKHADSEVVKKFAYLYFYMNKACYCYFLNQLVHLLPSSRGKTVSPEKIVVSSYTKHSWAEREF